MNRRNFFKAVTGFVAGIFTGSAKSEPKALTCGGKNSTLFPRCKFNGETSTSIDPNSEWAKKEPLTLAKLREIQEQLEAQKAANQQKGAYIKTSELKCLLCGYITKLPSGYYEFGTRVICNCGNSSRFVAFVEV